MPRFYTSVLDQQLATQFGASGQLGFARLIEAQLSRMMLPAEGGGIVNNPAFAGAKRFPARAAMPAGADPGAERFAASTADAAPTLPAATGRSRRPPRFCCRVWPHRCGGEPGHRCAGTFPGRTCRARVGLGPE